MTGLPQDRYPTPEEWADWFLGLGRERQLQAAERVVRNAETATCCFERHSTAPPP